MTIRDLRWRGVGVALIAAAVATGLVDAPGYGSALGLGQFLLAMAGLVLLVQGRRAALAVRVERSRHRALPGAINARRRAPHR